jgi:hypothetical protein
MKTLKESILSSTKTGKEGISDLIENNKYLIFFNIDRSPWGWGTEKNTL